MECQHCGGKFNDKVEFDSHLNFHINVQKELRRAKDRSYGARYVSAKKKDNAQRPGRTTDKSHRQSERSASDDAPTPHDTHHLSKKVSPPSSSQSGTLFIAIDDRAVPRTANWGARTPEAVRGLQKVLENYPIFPYGPNGPQLDSPLSTASDVSCQHCAAIFSNRDDLNKHYLSKYCPGVSGIVHLMIYDSSKVGNYRLGVRLVPFDHNTLVLEFQCRKCETCFETEIEADEHEGTHPNEEVTCLHCSKLFSTSHELEQHYDFHDDMEFRHKRDKLRAGESYGHGNEDSILEQPGVERLPMPGSGVERIPRKDRDVIALSFISGEDLERVHAPRGIFRESSEYYYRIPQHLDPDNEPGSISYRDGELCIVGGQIGTIRAGKFDDELLEEKAAAASGTEPKRTAGSPVEETSRISHMLGLGKKNEKADKPNTSEKVILRRSSTLTELNPPGGQPTDLDAIVHGRDSGASGETKSAHTRDRRASQNSKRPIVSNSSEHGPEPYGISLHGHGGPGGMFMNDKSKRSMLITATLVEQILAYFVKSEKISKARAKAVTLLKRANASNQRGDLANAVNAWSTALSIFREVPELDPSGDFELVVLWELANCLDKMHQSLDAELYFFATLEHSQKKFGREFSNSYKCVNCLGVLYENLGRLDEASAMYQRSIAGRAKVLGEWHWDTAMSLQELGTVNLKLEDYEAALPLFERALRGFENGEGPHRNFTLFVMSNLSNVYLRLGMDEELRRLLNLLIPKAAEELGAEHPVTGEAVCKYIECCGKENLPDGVTTLVEGYRQSYERTRSEVARWILEMC